MQAGELMKWLWWTSTMLMLAGCAGTPFSFEDKNAAAPLSGTVLITEDGKCPGEGEASQTVAKGPALGMSECQVVTVLGQADKIELAANERGDRTAVLTYTKGERPGIYRFVAGYLTAIERGAEPPVPAKPDRQRRKA